MIYGLMEDLRSDGSVLFHWVKGEEFVLQDDERKEQRVQLAGFRVFAAIGMVFAGTKVITFLVTFPIKVLLHLSLGVALYALAHDVFKMSQNSNQEGFTPKKPKPYLFRLFSGQEVSEEELARKFSTGTFFQPIWMWLYVNRNKVGGKTRKSKIEARKS